MLGWHWVHRMFVGMYRVAKDMTSMELPLCLKVFHALLLCLHSMGSVSLDQT